MPGSNIPNLRLADLSLADPNLAISGPSNFIGSRFALDRAAFQPEQAGPKVAGDHMPEPNIRRGQSWIDLDHDIVTDVFSKDQIEADKTASTRRHRRDRTLGKRRGASLQIIIKRPLAAAISTILDRNVLRYRRQDNHLATADDHRDRSGLSGHIPLNQIVIGRRVHRSVKVVE
jgi:hypothetical protein